MKNSVLILKFAQEYREAHAKKSKLISKKQNPDWQENNSRTFFFFSNHDILGSTHTHMLVCVCASIFMHVPL